MNEFTINTDEDTNSEDFKAWFLEHSAKRDEFWAWFLERTGIDLRGPYDGKAWVELAAGLSLAVNGRFSVDEFLNSMFLITRVLEVLE